MLYEFLTDHREPILALTRDKTLAISESRPSSEVLERGLPIFYGHLIAALRDAEGPSLEGQSRSSPATCEHGRELSRLGYTVSQVVHGYGVICQAIAETAQATGAGFTAKEFCALNLCLDKAIAEAVTDFERSRDSAVQADESKRMGFLAHELRNILSSASLAFQVIRDGSVGARGSMGDMVERDLSRMRAMIDVALCGVRLNSEAPLEPRPLRLIDVAEEVEATAALEARSRGITLSVRVEAGLRVKADRQTLISAVANLVQNAIKFTKPGTFVTLRSREDDTSAILEVEDCCGGLPQSPASELFEPFIQKGSDRTGCGLGLAISRRAVSRNGGRISVRDIPGKGCVFSVALPKLPLGAAPVP